MPDVLNEKTIGVTIQSDLYTVVKDCVKGCKDFKYVIGWKYCPFCGEEIKITEDVKQGVVKEGQDDIYGTLIG